MPNCFYCESPMYKPGRDRAAEFLWRAGYRLNQRGSERFLQYSLQTREHLKRKADGGRGEGNIVAACAWCNNGRGSASVESHKERMAGMAAAGTHPVAQAYVASRVMT